MEKTTYHKPTESLTNTRGISRDGGIAIINAYHELLLYIVKNIDVEYQAELINRTTKIFEIYNSILEEKAEAYSNEERRIISQPNEEDEKQAAILKRRFCRN